MPPLNDEETNALLGRVAQLEADVRDIAETIQKYVPSTPVVPIPEPVAELPAAPNP
jgi:hypothetical protein